VPAASIAVDLALVAVGFYLYWRAAVRTTRAAGDPRTSRANLLGGSVFAAGISVLALDAFTG
jgi:hypothetical protein